MDNFLSYIYLVYMRAHVQVDMDLMAEGGNLVVMGVAWGAQGFKHGQIFERIIRIPCHHRGVCHTLRRSSFRGRKLYGGEFIEVSIREQVLAIWFWGCARVRLR